MSNTEGSLRPRERSPWLIYLFDAGVVASSETWPAHLTRIRSMGFDTVCWVGAMPDGGSAGSRIVSGPCVEFCRQVVAHGLVPMAMIARPAALAEVAALGFRAFRCVADGADDTQAWSGAIARCRSDIGDSRFLLDGLSLRFDDQIALAGGGFDAALDSSAWWDGAAPWYFEQREALARVVLPVGFVEDPRIGRLAARMKPAGPGQTADAQRDADSLAAPYLARHLWTLAVSHGLSMPMGFEFGSTAALADSLADSLAGRGASHAAADEAPRFDLAESLGAMNRGWCELAVSREPGRLEPMLAPGGALAAVWRQGADVADGPGPALVAATCPGSGADPAGNAAPSLDPAAALVAGGGAYQRFEPWHAVASDIQGPARRGRSRPRASQPSWTVAPGTTRCWLAVADTPEADDGEASGRRGRRTGRKPATSDDVALAAMRTLASTRIAIEGVAPMVDAGRFPVKRMIGDALQVSADIFCDGHDQLAAEVLLWVDGQAKPATTAMVKGENDRWSAAVRLTRVGRARFAIRAWRDVFASWRIEVDKKRAAGLEVPVELAEGIALVRRTREGARGALAGRLDAVIEALDAPGADAPARLARLLSTETGELMRAADLRQDCTEIAEPLHLVVDRTRAVFGAWYELFPRSAADDTSRHGTFDDVIARLPYIRSMGFDVLYFPPIHPIGRINRKGPNNSLTSGPGDPGSPYAIGSTEGGHTALHPDLGDFDAFARLVRAAGQAGMEIALDFAIQCAPDHPWIRSHPHWFDWRPDGTLKYAENPPKKYEDISNVRFYDDGPVSDLWLSLRDVILFWIDKGVRIFRVDNPHTKPYPFWEWLIGQVQARHPDAVFLAEAFTRPKVMARLAKLGFTQSYSYFTWRTGKAELTAYLTELTQAPLVDVMRPNFFVNTPDINPFDLQTGGRAQFRVRAALAATLSTSWGMLAGYELCEATPLPGREEFLDSEKYQLRARDWSAPGRITDDIARLNRIRRHNPALWQMRNLQFHHAWNDQILVYSKWSPARDNLILVAVNLDPHQAQECDFEAPLWTLGLPDDASVRVDDLIEEGQSFVWHGKIQRVRLDPAVNPVAIWRLSA